MGAFNGVFSPVPATKLGSAAIAEALKRIQLPSERVDEVYMGCVLSAGLGQAPARLATSGGVAALLRDATTGFDPGRIPRVRSLPLAALHNTTATNAV